MAAKNDGDGVFCDPDKGAKLGGGIAVWLATAVAVVGATTRDAKGFFKFTEIGAENGD